MKNFEILSGIVGLMLLLIVSIFILGFINNIETKSNVISCGTYAPYIPMEPSMKVGEALFKANCATCHNKNMKADMTGPALGGALKRFNNDTLAYADFIRGSQAYIKKGHDKRVMQLFEDFNRSVMQDFPNLKDEDIKAIIAYTENMYRYGYY